MDSARRLEVEHHCVRKLKQNRIASVQLSLSVACDDYYYYYSLRLELGPTVLYLSD